ncbi:cytochrome P450 [Chaetomium sp. MPI-CAGE-AT-0009]|nr:cytochrome P450 [Chaetomium sp. MPI-CAGE-AT-0009]
MAYSALPSLGKATWSDLQVKYRNPEWLGDWMRQGAYLIVFLVLLVSVSVGIYRVYLSPLAKIPGPKLAALTYLYEAYYEVWLGGKYFLRVTEMHKQYGPIVRITPNEVHFSDPEFLDGLYPAVGRKTDKPHWFSLRTGTPYSIVSTTHHDLHRQRRNAVNAFFSTASIHRLEHIMREHVAKMLARLETAGQSGDVVQIHHIFKACASDVITVYAFDQSLKFMDMPDYGKAHFESTDRFFLLTHLCFLFPWLMPLIQFSPNWLLRLLFPFLSELRERQNWWLAQVRSIRSSPNPERVKRTIFEGILNSKLPPEEKTDIRLASEAQLVVFAGEGTTAWSLTAALYELLAHPQEVAKLKAELATIGRGAGGMPALSDVEALPYLGAIIQEAVRLHPGVMARQMRVSPEAPIRYHDRRADRAYVVPPGTVVSMSPLDTHMNADAFAQPYQFRPSRWIEDPKLARYFHGFARGSRNCVGMTLARREMALILASFFLKYEIHGHGQEGGHSMELFETERARDIDANGDFIIPVAAKGSHGLRIKLRSPKA